MSIAAIGDAGLSTCRRGAPARAVRFDSDGFKGEFGKNLKIRMLMADVSAEQLAVRSGLSIDTVRQLMRGGAGPLLETAVRISRVLGCGVDDLCGSQAVVR